MLFRPLCVVCHAPAYARPDGTSLCVGCALGLSGSALARRQKAPTDPHSLFRYQGPVRQLIRRAKAQEDHRALSVLVRLFLDRDESLDEAARCDVIVPCPSSLWSRCRGRLDVAWRLAEALAKRTAKPILAAPWHLHWRTLKQARLSGRARRLQGRALGSFGAGRFAAHAASCFARRLEALGDPTRVLIVDDVVTTGMTLAAVRAAIHAACSLRQRPLPDAAEAFEIRSLTLAVAGRGPRQRP
jgi:predicted amidophosphoribosyltransferase